MKFLRTALEMNLPMVMQHRNPKRAQSVSRHRYEKYNARKSSTAIDDAMGDSRIMSTYCYADLAGDEGTRKSTSSFCMGINGGLVC